jgi:non-ribosomal peptide synthetase component F
MYPRERLAFMLEDTRASALITQRRLLETLPDHAASALCIDSDWDLIAVESGENPGPQATSHNVAYVIYTSGSTGKPKGVAIEHRSAVAFLCWAREVFSQEDLAGVLASTSICFDLSVFELLGPLSWGGKVILVENALSLPSLPSALEVTLINTVPSAMAELAGGAGAPDSVRTINLAGEPLTAALAQQIYRQPTIGRVYN